MNAKRKRSKNVRLATLGALSLAIVSLTACSNDDGPTTTADCVMAQKLPDGSYQPAKQVDCDNDHDHSGFIMIYGGSPYVGSGGRHAIRGGTSVMPKTGNVVTRGGTTIRGGFGGSSKGGGGS